MCSKHSIESIELTPSKVVGAVASPSSPSLIGPNYQHHGPLRNLPNRSKIRSLAKSNSRHLGTCSKI